MPRLESGEIHPDHKVIFADRHKVTLTPGGAFANMLTENHPGQFAGRRAFWSPASAVIIEGVAENGAVEAIR